jgi:hypothetical protein
MRFIYLDEAGISNPANEPYLVVAGVIIDADHQWMAVEPHLHVLAETRTPASAPELRFPRCLQRRTSPARPVHTRM